MKTVLLQAKQAMTEDVPATDLQDEEVPPPYDPFSASLVNPIIPISPQDETPHLDNGNAGETFRESITSTAMSLPANAGESEDKPKVVKSMLSYCPLQLPSYKFRN